MVLLDRVACNCCGVFIGQLWDQPAPAADLLQDLTTAPHFALCPDCVESSEAVSALEVDAA
ncbi:hypothetical protein D3C80_498530 [compost metagenome]